MGDRRSAGPSSAGLHRPPLLDKDHGAPEAG